MKEVVAAREKTGECCERNERERGERDRVLEEVSIHIEIEIQIEIEIEIRYMDRYIFFFTKIDLFLF